MPHNPGIAADTATDRTCGDAADQEGVARARRSLIDELEIAVSRRNIGSRADVLRKVTDLFVAGSDRFGDEQRALFDDVMSRLVMEIQVSARAEFGKRLAATRNAPTGVSRALALDGSIEVAGALLERSDQLNDETLISGAHTMSQEHLLAISRRTSLSEGVTDVLVERGNREVVVSTAENTGAKFSEFGYSTLVTKAEADDELALTVLSRPEMTREYLLPLFAKASEAVRLKFEAADPGKAALVRDMVKQAADKIQTLSRGRSPAFAAAQAQVEALHRAGELTEERLNAFAQAGKFDDAVVALALLSDLPIGAIERTLMNAGDDQTLVLAKSVGLSWDTTRAILGLRREAAAGSPQNSPQNSPQALALCLARFNKLKPETARTAMQFYRLRERANKA